MYRSVFCVEWPTSTCAQKYVDPAPQQLQLQTVRLPFYTVQIPLIILTANKALVLLSSHASGFTQQASNHRLNNVQSRAQNSLLTATAEVKIKTAAFQQQSRAEIVTVYASLYSLPNPGGTLKKVEYLSENTHTRYS